jgi:hypothetical protein
MPGGEFRAVSYTAYQSDPHPANDTSITVGPDMILTFTPSSTVNPGVVRLLQLINPAASANADLDAALATHNAPAAETATKARDKQYSALEAARRYHGWVVDSGSGGGGWYGTDVTGLNYRPQAGHVGVTPEYEKAAKAYPAMAGSATKRANTSTTAPAYLLDHPRSNTGTVVVGGNRDANHLIYKTSLLTVAVGPAPAPTALDPHPAPVYLGGVVWGSETVSSGATRLVNFSLAFKGAPSGEYLTRLHCAVQLWNAQRGSAPLPDPLPRGAPPIRCN